MPSADTVHAVLAVKPLDRAKSRLAERFCADERARLVLAMLTDTVTAVRAAGVASVTVVTPDCDVAATAELLGAFVTPEPVAANPIGLNGALRAAAAAVALREGSVNLLALQPDLPALRAHELTAMLAAAPAQGRALVADHAGVGTTALLASTGKPALAPRFGPDSARWHLASGAVALLGGWPGLRRDVDTIADLAAATALGVGPATAALLHDLVNTPAAGG